MRLQELADSIRESLLGGDPSGMDVIRTDKESSSEYAAIPKNSKDDKPVGTLVVRNSVIVELNIDDEASDHSGISNSLLRAVCKDADRSNTPLVIASEAITKTRTKRFLERFGFLDNGDGQLERRPGASLPYSVLQ